MKNGGWIFLAMVFLAYMLLALTDYPKLQETIGYFTMLVANITPILLLVFGLMFLSNLFLEQKRITRYIGGESGLRGWFIAIMGGVISTGPVYMWYPLLRDLRDKGMRISLLTAFIYSRSIKIPVFPVMLMCFGLTFTLLITIYTLFFSVINGLVMEFLSLRFKWF
ncbi:MAG: permease [Candidatus Altiarchaeales archaeon ex4484_2]|nr:MAG: permease [Candidatus Altiarchaeales archaeon ex4484_2]